MARYEAAQGQGFMMSEAQKIGTLFGVGVGPGDPELLTLKGHRLISSSPVIVYPVNGRGESLARDIVTDAISPDALELPIHVPMKTAREPAQVAYDGAADEITTHLDQGRDVVFLCAGDPFFYGSFMYLFQRIKKTHQVSVIPGVTSLTACAAALEQPLASRDDVLSVIPATLPEDRLKAELADIESAVIVKVGRHFEKVRKVLAELNLTTYAGIVERASCEGEKITPLSDMPSGERPYFSTILIYRGAETW